MKPFVETISVADYDRLPAIRSSHLKKFMESPAHYKYMIDNPSDQDQKHLLVGTFVHGLILEPDTIRDRFYYADVGNRTAKEYKAIRAKARADGKEGVLLLSELAECEAMAASALSDPYIRALVDEAHPEVSAVAKIEGVWCKARMDGYLPHRKTMFDIKTTGDSAFWFKNTALRYGYDISAAFYQDIVNAAGDEVDEFLFIVIEKEAPYCCRIMRASGSFLSNARTRYIPALQRFKKCLETNEWPGYDNSNIMDIE